MRSDGVQRVNGQFLFNDAVDRPLVQLSARERVPPVPQARGLGMELSRRLPPPSGELPESAAMAPGTAQLWANLTPLDVGAGT